MLFRAATTADIPTIWKILQQAIEQRRQDGSEQWQHGYPNEQTVRDDVDAGYAYVLIDEQVIIAYAALIVGIEPAYDVIEGRWLTDGPYAAVHRVARSTEVQTKGIATEVLACIERICREKGVPSIRLDTNYDNRPMLRLLEKLRYTYCGEIQFQGASRMAYEKVLAD